jgi:hypothetical protein
MRIAEEIAHINSWQVCGADLNPFGVEIIWSDANTTATVDAGSVGPSIRHRPY